MSANSLLPLRVAVQVSHRPRFPYLHLGSSSSPQATTPPTVLALILWFYGQLAAPPRGLQCRHVS